MVRGGYRTWYRLSDQVAVIHRFRTFPVRAISWGRRFAASDRVEPHDIWHGMWAPSLPMLHAVARRHGGVTLYDPRDVFLRSRIYAPMPRWQLIGVVRTAKLSQMQSYSAEKPQKSFFQNDNHCNPDEPTGSSGQIFKILCKSKKIFY